MGRRRRPLIVLRSGGDKRRRQKLCGNLIVEKSNNMTNALPFRVNEVTWIPEMSSKEWSWVGMING